MKSVLLAVVCAFFLVQLPTAQTPQNSSFVGEWKSVKPSTDPLGFIPAIKVFDQGGELKIQAWGKCEPKDCEWPPVRFWQLRDFMGKDPDRGFAVFPDGKHLAMRLDGDQLLVEMYQTSDVKISATRTRTQFMVLRYARSTAAPIGVR